MKKLEILCHRGAWRIAEERNTLAALESAIMSGHGFESDVRDYCGNLVISHDLPDENSLKFEEVIKLLESANNQFCFAINIKSDGIADIIKYKLEKHKISNYFTFDMSLPQMLYYREIGLNYFTRQSEYEKTPMLYEDAAGVWLDSFESDDWVTTEVIEEHLNNGKKVCIVSPELHNRQPQKLWSRLKKINSTNLYLCTDLLTNAKEYFNE